MIEIPKPNEGEKLNEYVKRLIDDGAIQASNIPLAIRIYNQQKTNATS